MTATKPNGLDAYRAKRSADRTPEPFGTKTKSQGHLFVVQHHAARHLHYDFRLEMDGVLRSWAVPKGPSPNPADKRLAVMVEDHPLEYASFEGQIPEGNYGAGAVILWDRGSWIPLNEPDEGLRKGKLLFELKGYKLRGRWTLVKTKRAPKEWLLIKERDNYVSESGTESFPQDSILSGRTVHALKEGRSPATAVLTKLKNLGAPRRRVAPAHIKVMLAQAGTAFSKPGWLFEIKYDGYRLVVARTNEAAILYSRAGNDLTASFPEIATAVEALPFEHILIDGEVVVHDERGIPSFSRLQKRGRLTRRTDIQRASLELPATLYAFDLLGFGGYDLRALPLHTRKSLLKDVLPSIGPVRYSDHIEEHGEELYEQVLDMGLEGIVAKHSDSRYRAGRSPWWVKISAERTGDFVVAGYTDSKSTQPEFGALLLAAYQGGELVYAGRAGSGFTHKDRKEIGERLKSAISSEPPRAALAENGAHWVRPEFVCEVKFKETTPDGLLRQPVFIRLRYDKHTSECVREFKDALPEPAQSPTMPAIERTVTFTNPKKVFWPNEGYTKGDLIEFYRRIAHWLLPYLADRPVVLDRFPDGIDGKSFFQKDAPQFAPDWIRIERLWSEHSEREIGYFIVEDEASLLYIVNLGTIPLHVWSSRMGSLERPDWCILDLDPKGAPFKDVVKIAKAIRSLCEAIKLPSFLKSSGSAGLHVLVPLGKQYTYHQSRTLGELLARVVIRELPDIATITRALSGREGRVYIDYVQNGHGRLLVAPFSVRPLTGAPVSMPLRWRELTSKLDPRKFTIKNAVKRMRSLQEDPLLKVLELKPDLHAALEHLAQRFE